MKKKKWRTAEKKRCLSAIGRAAVNNRRTASPPLSAKADKHSQEMKWCALRQFIRRLAQCREDIGVEAFTLMGF